ncbi:MAG: AAA family ATPase [Lachnospira sp.]
MARPRVIIADEDASYIVPLQFKFVTDFFNKIDLEVITDKAYFDEYFSKPQNAEILIVSDELYDSSLQRHNIQNIFVMMEQYDEGGTGDLNVTRLFKYTSIKEIFNEIIGKSAGALNIAAVEKKETQIILVTSAAGGVGKTTVAMGVAACLAQNYKRVLYMNASRLQNFQNMLDNKTVLTSPDVYSKLLNPQENIYADLVHVIRKEVFSYIPAFKASLLSLGLDFLVYKKIISSVKQSEEYDFIVVDMESAFDERYTELLDIANKVIIVTTQTMQSVVHTNLLLSNINGVNSDKYIFVCNNFNPEGENALIRPETDMKFTIENYIEHVSSIEKTKIMDYAKVQGIQKTALFVM